METTELVRELAACGKALLKIAEALAKEETQVVDAGAPKEKQPELSEVRAVLAAKSRDGYTEGVRELLKKHGAERLSEVPREEYKALIAEAEGLCHAG